MSHTKIYKHPSVTEIPIIVNEHMDAGTWGLYSYHDDGSCDAVTCLPDGTLRAKHFTTQEVDELRASVLDRMEATDD